MTGAAWLRFIFCRVLYFVLGIKIEFVLRVGLVHFCLGSESGRMIIAREEEMYTGDGIFCAPVYMHITQPGPSNMANSIAMVGLDGAAPNVPYRTWKDSSE